MWAKCVSVAVSRAATAEETHGGKANGTSCGDQAASEWTPGREHKRRTADTSQSDKERPESGMVGSFSKQACCYSVPIVLDAAWAWHGKRHNAKRTLNDGL